MPGTIIVKPIQAKLNKEEGGLAKLDPYCVAIIGDRHAESDVCNKGGQNPAWHDALALQRVDEPYCYLEVKDKSLIKDKMLGICAIDLDDLAKQGNVQKWYGLYYDKKPAGEILVEASVVLGDEIRESSPERATQRASIFGEGSTASYGSAHKEPFARHEEHIIGHSPFSKKTYDTVISSNQSTDMTKISETLTTREYGTMSYQSVTEGNYGGIYTSVSEVAEANRSIESLNRTIDQILERSKAMDEERKIRESRLPYQLEPKLPQIPQIAQVHPLQDFQRQDSIPSENAGAEGVPLFPETHPGLVHASHDKFGDDSNAVSKAAEFRAKVLERVERSKEMIRQRVHNMREKEELSGEQGQPSMKYKVLTGIENVMTKRQSPQSERKAQRVEVETSSTTSNIKQKILGGVERVTHSSIKTLSRLENKLREKRGEEIEIHEEKLMEQAHSKSAKKESLKDKVEYYKDVSREKVLAKLRKPGVDEEIQTESRYLADEENVGVVEKIKEKVVDLKDAGVEKLEKAKSKKKDKKKSHKSSSSSSSSSSSDEETLKEKVMGGIEKGAKKVVVKLAKKKVEKAEENDEVSHPEVVHKKKKHHHHHGEQEGIVEKVKEKVGKEAKHIAIKAAKHKVKKEEERLGGKTEKEEDYDESQPKKSKTLKENITEGVEKVKSAIMPTQTEVKVATSQDLDKELHHEASMKEKFMAKIEQIKASANEHMAQFGSKEVEEHETAQQTYNEYERSAERTYDYQSDLSAGRGMALNNELIVGMKELTDTLDRLQAKIEAKISVQQSYGLYDTSTYDPSLIQEPHYSTEAPSMVASLKEKVKEGVEQLQSFGKAEEEGSATETKSIASLMDKLSQDIQESHIDDRLYLTKEYKQNLSEEKQRKTEHREARMRTLKLKVKEGFQHITHTQGTTTHYETVEPSGPVADLMNQLSEDNSKPKGAMSEHPGMIATIKQKVIEGVEQVKHMAHRDKESKEQAQEVFSAEGVPDMMISLEDKNQNVEPYTDTGFELADKEQETPVNLFKFDYAAEDVAASKEVEHKSAGIIGSIKQKIHEGIESVKGMVHKSGAPEELSPSEVFRPHNELRRSPPASPRAEEAKLTESLYVAGGDSELEVRESDLMPSVVSFGGGATANYAFETNQEIESKLEENVRYESIYVEQNQVGTSQHEKFEKEMDLFEQQMLGNKTGEQTPFDEAFEDFTTSANQYNF